jgi:glycosyltransferase involved in cell wall biosynthesis
LAPDHQGGGGHRRQAHLLDELARRWEVELVVAEPIRDPAVEAAVAEAVVVDGVTPRDRRSLKRRAGDLRLALAGPHHREVQLHGPVRSAVRAALRSSLRSSVRAGLTARRSPDLVAVETAAFAPLIPRRPTLPWVATLQNLASVMARQRAELAPSARLRWLERRDASHARRFERWLVAAYPHVVVVSDDDAALLPPGRAQVHVIPNGVDVSALAPSPVPTEPGMCFVGALYTQPNVDGVTWLATEILPLVRARVPEARLDVVGLRPVPSVLALDRLPGVRVHADVSSVESYVRAARVAVVPLRIGSGTRLKALEAMALGRPVVGTSIGLGGLAIEHGLHALVADDAPGLAAAIAWLLSDHEAASRLAAGGRRLTEERYGWPAIAVAYADLLESVADRWLRS